MEKKEIAIITRCFNRLEYTTRVIAQVRNNTKWNNYRHIIVDNGSTDGTQQWMEWIRQHDSTRQWYQNLIYFRNKANLGDWGGMRLGYKLYPEADYYVQLDNDILVPEGWLQNMVYVLENTSYQVVMIRRANVAWKLKPLNKPIRIKEGSLEVVKVERPVACFMMSRETMEMFYEKIPKGKGSKYEIRKLVKGQIAKIWNLPCQEIEADFQRKKYSDKDPEIHSKL